MREVPTVAASRAIIAATFLLAMALNPRLAKAACRSSNLMTWCSDSPLLRSDRDLWSQAIAVDSQAGATYVAGHFSGRADFRNSTYTSKSGLDVFVSRQVGEEVQWVFTATPWATQGGENLPIGFVAEYMKIKSLELDPAGKLLYVSGHFSGVVEAGGKKILRSMEEVSQDVFLMQLDADTGVLNWAISVGGDSIDTAYGLSVDKDSAYMSGSFFHMAVFGKTVLYTPHGMEGAFVMRVSRAGAIAWAQSVAHVLPDLEATDMRVETLGLEPSGECLRLIGSMGAPGGYNIATSKAMPSIYTALVNKNTGVYVDGSQDFFAFYSATLMTAHFDQRSNSLVTVFWCDEPNKGVLVDAGQAVWGSDNHEKIIALKLDFVEGSPHGRVSYLTEVADAFLLGNGRFLEPSVTVVQREDQVFLMGAVEGMVTFNDGTTSGRTVRSPTPRVFMTHLNIDGTIKTLEVMGGDNGVMLVTAAKSNPLTGGVEFTGVFKGSAQLGGAKGISMKASTPDKWDIYSASAVQSSAMHDFFEMYGDTASQAARSAGKIAGSRKGVIEALISSAKDI